MITLESIKTAGDPAAFNRSDIPVAVLLEGKFSSLYANRVSPETEDSLGGQQPFLKSGEKPARIIVCADADVVMNELSENRPLPLGFSKDINYTFANMDFLENCLEYCVNPSGILEARSKEYTLRLLDPEKTEDDKTFWQFVNIVCPLLVILLCGVGFQYIRKRKYSAR
jgi:gliding-associated putative ABC transporter substrate-binding component GldG